MSQNENLPPLPPHTLAANYKRGDGTRTNGVFYTAEQMAEYAMAAIAAHEQQPKFLGLKQPTPTEHGQNVGHGHVFPRPDGVRARCGGPPFCRECARDLARKQPLPEVKP